jgi:Peptidase MA superfamily
VACLLVASTFALPASGDAATAGEAWSVRVVGSLILQAPADSAELLDGLARGAERLLPRIEARLGLHPAAPYRILLIPPSAGAAGGRRDLDAVAPAWAAGYLFPERRIGAIRIGLADRYPWSDPLSVLVHESTHMLLHDASGGGLPRWFEEGVATGMERSWGVRDVLVYSSSLLVGRLPGLQEMDAAFEASEEQARAAYAASFDFVHWVARRRGEGALGAVALEARDRPFAEAWERVIGEPLSRSERSWRHDSLLLYRWLPALTGTATLWMSITALALLAAARRRARDRAILQRWSDEEGDTGPGTP